MYQRWIVVTALDSGERRRLLRLGKAAERQERKERQQHRQRVSMSTQRCHAESFQSRFRPSWVPPPLHGIASEVMPSAFSVHQPLTMGVSNSTHDWAR